MCQHQESKVNAGLPAATWPPLAGWVEGVGGGVSSGGFG